MAKTALSDVNTEKAMKNLDILLRAFEITKKEAEDGVSISSGYLTRLANPNNGKKLSLDLELLLENYLDIPQFTLDSEEIEYPNSDDEFIIRVLEKMNRQTRSGELSWTEIKQDQIDSEPAWRDLFKVDIAKDEPFKGNSEFISNTPNVTEKSYLVSSVYETFIADGQKIIFFETGTDTGEYEVDRDNIGNEYPYRVLDFHYEILLVTGERQYKEIADDYHIKGKPGRKPLQYSLRRLFNVVNKETKNKMTKETFSILSNYLSKN